MTPRNVPTGRRRKALIAAGTVLALGTFWQGSLATVVANAAAKATGGTTANAAKQPANPGNGQGNSGNGNGNGGSTGGNTNTPKTFIVKGLIADGADQELAPGVARTLTLRIDNPNNQPIRVTKLTVTAADASTDCPASWLHLGTPATRGSGSQTESRIVAKSYYLDDVPFAIMLDADAPDACQNVTWNLAYGGTAVQS